MNASIADWCTVLACELKPAALSVRNSVHPDIWFISSLIGSICPKASERILGPMRGLETDQGWKLFVWLRAKEAEEWFKERVDVLCGSHCLNPLGQRFDNLDREFFSTTHDPIVTGDRHVRKYGCFVNGAISRSWIVDELVVVLR